MDPREVIEAYGTFWSVQDVERCMAFIAEDAVWKLRVAETALPFAGETRGRENIRAGFYAILKDWDYLECKFTVLGVSGESVRVRIDHRYHHRASGQDLAGSYRIVFNVVDGEITLVDEFIDAAMVEAFMRLVELPEQKL